jgi:hypothetical protein
MKTISDLENFYQYTLLADLRRLERIRVQIVYKVIAFGLLVIGLSYLLMIYVSGWFLFAPLAAIGPMMQYVQKNYTPDFKATVIRKLIGFLDPGLEYFPEDRVPVTDFNRSGLFNATANTYSGDDRVSGVVGKTKIDFSEVHAQYLTEENAKRSTNHTIFKGLFLKADFNKHFHGKTLVLPDEEERIWGRLATFIQKLDWTRPPLVRLEDREFENYFVVYSTDQTEARYILSPAFMKRIIDFRKKTNQPVFMSFVASHIYVAIGNARPFFEPQVFHTLLDFSPIRKYFEDLQLGIGIVDDLNLNTRIWTKE